MLSLLLIVKRFGTIVRHGWSDRDFRGLSLVLAFWITLGTIVYSINESWSVVQSLYFSVMTLTTIGYGDFAPTSDLMRLYTVLYSIMGVGFFVAFNTRLVQVAVEVQRRQLEDGKGDADDR
ncbi:MAG: potassium channel family protein [Actinomycetota bacterium]